MKKFWKYCIALFGITAACVACQKQEPSSGNQTGGGDNPTPPVKVTTLKDFAEQFVTYLDVWKRTTGTVSADASHKSENGTAWKNVHFIPIPYSDSEVVKDGKDQYASNYQPYPTITVDDVEYSAVQAFTIAANGFLDLVTTQGSAALQTDRNTPVHTLGNGAALTEEMPELPSDEWTWGKYPWYEINDVINLSDEVPCNLDFITRAVAWGLGKAKGENTLANFVRFGTDPSSSIVKSPYTGHISIMRMFLILCRFYDYILENNITENVYDAVKDVKFDYDLYGRDILLSTQTLTFTSDQDQTGQGVTFTAKKAWTAEVDSDWLSVEPASGAASDNAKITVKVHSNTKNLARTGKVIIKGGNVTDGVEITVSQQAYVIPLNTTAWDFAIAFTKCLDVWDATVGRVDSDGKHNGDNTGWKNVHFIPIEAPQGRDAFTKYNPDGSIDQSFDKVSANPYGTSGNQYDSKYEAWTLKLGETELTSAQTWEVASRLFLNLVTEEGAEGLSSMKTRNDKFTLSDGGRLSDTVPTYTAECIWGSTPWYEYDNLVKYKGAAIDSVDVNFLMRAVSVHLAKAFVKNTWNTDPKGYITNFTEFGDNGDTIIEEGYKGYISPMREFVVLARVFKYIVDNDIHGNVYTALKDKKFDFDMYHQGEPAKTPASTDTPASAGYGSENLGTI